MIMGDGTTGVRKGRGAISNRDGRFEVFRHQAVDDGWPRDGQPVRVATQVIRDTSRTVIARNQSPDVPFEQSVNPYRGCEHGCVYCFARPTHCYLGMSAGLDFETKLLVKPDVVELLRAELAQPGYRCKTLAFGTNTDPYQPVEREYRLMRGILELMVETAHPLGIVTKSALIERDTDLLQALARDRLVQVTISITTLDHTLARRLEPRAAAPRRRLMTIEKLAAAGIPVAVNVAPVIPVLTDSEFENVLQQAAVAGATGAAYIMLRLPWEVSELFQEWLRCHYPLKAGHVMSVIRQLRGGKDYDASFGTRRRGAGPFADLIAQRFARASKRLGLNQGAGQGMVTGLFRRPRIAQQEFDF
jgi:DNA repair photolyase